jgi:hypothetical protein
MKSMVKVKWETLSGITEEFYIGDVLFIKRKEGEEEAWILDEGDVITVLKEEG